VNFREHGIMQCLVFGQKRSQQSWQTGLLGVVKWREVGAYLLESSVYKSQLCLGRQAERRA
jgi:hypothetical protein